MRPSTSIDACRALQLLRLSDDKVLSGMRAAVDQPFLMSSRPQTAVCCLRVQRASDRRRRSYRTTPGVVRQEPAVAKEAVSKRIVLRREGLVVRVTFPILCVAVVDQRGGHGGRVQRQGGSLCDLACVL